MGYAILFDAPSTTDHQRRLNNELSAFLGEPLSMAHVSGYDAVYALKAGIEKAQSLEPKAVAAALRSARFKSFYGEIGYGGKDAYGADIQPLIPVYITQIVNGKLVERASIAPITR
jgi:branched-chain amino acid transport system substrate-binding protein